MEGKLSIIPTTDGSQTIRNELTGDTYHSIHGAIQESEHIYIKNGLEYFTQSFPNKKLISILEMGFGTGLNALLSLQFARSRDIKIEYISFEAYPLELEIYSQLNYPEKETLMRLHECNWEVPVSLTPNFNLTKHKADLTQSTLPIGMFEVIYYDAFAPKSQPELWTKDIFEKLMYGMACPSVLVSYCVKGEVKRFLKELNLAVDTPNGPPGKRSMLRAKSL